MKKTYAQTLQAIGDDFSSSNWLIKAVSSNAARDPVDALNDAETLLALCQLRVDELTGPGRRS